MESQHQLLKDISAGQQASGSDGPEEFLERDAAVAELHELLTSFRNAAAEEGEAGAAGSQPSVAPSYLSIRSGH